jgi:hypothetical protein
MIERLSTLVTDAVATALTEPGAPRTQRSHTQATSPNAPLLKRPCSRWVMTNRVTPQTLHAER